MYLLAMLLAAQAPSDAPAWKLVLQWGGGGAVNVIAYPSRDRCEDAAGAVEREAARRIANTQRNNPPGAVVVNYNAPQAFCIPG